VSPCVDKNDRALHIKIKIKVKQRKPFNETSVSLVAPEKHTERGHRRPLSRVLVPTSFQHLPHVSFDPRIALVRWSTATSDMANNSGLRQPIEWHFPREDLDQCTYIF
jgi:hypothetical protein